ncbi:MAG: O-acetyl-ADP-ribose deacetylase [Clostridia bacterium]|nr:O-acetyl-ADP-ribose deacetylase [Clostridia bacterium]
MPIEFVRNDITRMKVDAIVNAANESLLGGGGVDGAIHSAAGPELLAECRTLGGCRTGDARITAGYRLPCRYVIHTVGPVWHGGKDHEAELLASCYRRSLELAAEKECATVAFPMISTGVYGYPKAEAARIALDTVRAFLDAYEEDMTVYLVVFGRESLEVAGSLQQVIRERVDDAYTEERIRRDSRRRNVGFTELSPENSGYADACFDARVMTFDEACPAPAPKSARIGKKKLAASRTDIENAVTGAGIQVGAAAGSIRRPSEEEMEKKLREMLRRQDEGFTGMLLRKIDERGMKDSECYKKANVDRRHFSHIRNGDVVHPKKKTVLAFAVALQLSAEETAEMLKKAGYAFSSDPADVIVKCCIEHGVYDIFEINGYLFAYDQETLGG